MITFAPQKNSMTDIVKTYENGGKIEVYRLVNQSAGDYKKIYACCEYFAKQGAHTVITPTFLVETIGNPIYEEIYASLRNTQYWGKCPDFKVNGAWYEHEGYDLTKDLTENQKRADTFCWMMKRGVKQSDRIIVEDCNVVRRYARRTIFNRVNIEHQNITEVYIRTEEGLELLYKKGTD